MDVAAAPAPLSRERDVLGAALEQIRARIPQGWRLEPYDGPMDRRRADAVLSLVPPQGPATVLVVEVKSSLVTRDLPGMLEQLNGYIAATFPARRGTPGALPLIASRYLSTPLQRWLTERNVAYCDATGNLRVALDRPALFVRDVGATRDPWRGPGRPKGNLTGEPAARVVRALADYAPPYSVPRLVELSGASTGPTYRVVDFLAEQAVLERAVRGPIKQVRWVELLRRWSQDYGFLRTHAVTNFLAPRGLPVLSSGLAELPNQNGLRYAVTGSLAAQNWAPYAPARAAMIYCDDSAQLANQLDLRPVDSGGNVLLAQPAYEVVYDRADTLEGVVTVAPSQAAVDLITGPGRNPAEGEALLDWMEANVDRWQQ
ncbi:MAG: hypothetical protein ACRDU4_03430 [Mycobacterium sp.]